MLNYMRSECYRLKKDKGFYKAVVILGGLVLAMNVVLALAGNYLPGFRYGTVRFSLNMYTSGMFFTVILGAVVPACLFWEDRKNGVLKNAISYGISREKLFVGKCIVAFYFTFLTLCAVLAIYAVSAWLLLDHQEWEPLKELLMGVVASLPSGIGSLIFSILLGCIFQKEMTSVIIWISVYYVIPMVFFLVGMKIELLAKVFRWMPYCFLGTEAMVSMNAYQCPWDTAGGLGRCLLSGFIGIVIFILIGCRKFRKQEL